MSATQVAQRTRTEAPPLSTLAKLTAGCLAVIGLVFLSIRVMSGDGEADLAVFAGLTLTAAAVALVPRLRWAPLPAGLLSLAITFIGPFFQPYTVYHLTHPQDFGLFAGTVVLTASGVVGAAAGLGATWQNYRGARPAAAGMPRWTATLLTGLAGVVLGAVAVSLVTATVGPATGATSLAGTPVRYVAEDTAYRQAPGDVAAGALAITLENRGAITHNVAFDSVDDGAAVVAAAAGETATGSVELQPGTYTYFCSVPGHREAGMEGRLTVD